MGKRYIDLRSGADPNFKAFGAGWHYAPPSLIVALLFILSALTVSVTPPPAHAQQGVIANGDVVVTGASGTVAPQGQLPPGASEIDETFIDLDGASLRVFDLSNPGAPPTAQLLEAPVKFEARAGDIGQVFGIAVDDSPSPDIFVGATSVHGLHIVLPDVDGDGRPERIKVGQPGAAWMDGQFGLANGGGPGTIWKVDGETGELSKFADLLANGQPNSGSGIGNIAYDAKHKQLFVSDLDTGLVHRFDINGSATGTFDHGLQGRPANGLPALQDDGRQANITDPSFDAEDPGTWGLTPGGRQVWGLAVYKDRLYYAISEGPQIWSVGITADGNFGSDPRWELDVTNDPDALPITDIAFQSNGRMLLAQRGGVSSRYDYSRYHTPRKSRVLRYRLEGPDDPDTPSRWSPEPEDYAIGFPGNYRNASGGIAIGYGYRRNTDGSYAYGSCEGTLWSTGDALRDNPVHAGRLAGGGALNVHGLQGNAISLVRPKNVPPFESYFVDFDGMFDDPQASGHVGDVEIPRKCGGKRANVMDLRILKRAKPERCAKGEECEFEVTITNTGNLTYTGPLVVQDVAHNGAVLVGHAPPAWNCRELFPGIGVYECAHPETTLAPGQSITLELTFRTPGWWVQPAYDNCVDLWVPGAGVDQRRYNNRSCDYVAFCTPGTPGCVPDLQLRKYGRYGACDFLGLCEFSVIITNVGAVSWTGQLNVDDFATTPGATLVDWSPKPDWNCAATGPDRYGCSTAGPVTLAPGEFRELIILVQGPPIAPGFTHVRNCAVIDWDGAQRDDNPHNEFDCAEIASLPPGHPDARSTVTVQKDALSATCSRPGVADPWTCSFQVIITNSGTAPLEGPIEFTDVASAHPATLAGFAGAPGAWACAPGIGVAGNQTCTHPPIPGGLAPGDIAWMWMWFTLPPATPPGGVEQNCATVQWDNDGDGANEAHESCATVLICTPGSGDCPQDLGIAKLDVIGICPKGTSCPFDIRVSNFGFAPSVAPLTISDTPANNTGAPNVLTPGWACAAAGGSYNCTNPAPLPPNSDTVVSVEFPIPAGYLGNTFQNCADIPPGTPGNTVPGNDNDCASAIVPQPLPADLAPWSDTTCYKGKSCKLPGRIDNLGEQTFTGSAGLAGTLSPDLPISGIVSKTPGFTCKKTANSRYECSGSRLSIAPGKAVEYEVTVNVPADYPHSKVNHIKSMLWPDEKVRDRNSKNDQHLSVITIAQDEKPESPPPPPPPPPAGTPDLAISKTASKSLCNANIPCVFTLTITNIGNASYSGGLTVRDTITPGATRYVGRNNGGWNCTGNRGGVTCTKPNVTLAPGASDSVILHFAVPRYGSGTANNCATVSPGVTAAPRSGNTVRDVQAALAAQGYYKGRVDGQAGPQTAAAVREYQRLYNMPQTGRIDRALVDRLLGASSGSTGGGDSNPNNNRACASVSIQGEAPPPPPPQCTGGQYLSRSGQCVCPASKPVWTGRQCIQRPPQQCTGGRIRKGSQCVCPPSLPVWNGQYCSGIPGPQCSGGRIKDRAGRCVCPSNKPVWTGTICVPRVTICTGGRQLINGRCVCTGRREFRNGRCQCPVSLPHWNGKTCGGIIGPQCSGGRIKDRYGNCKCPPNRPVWSGTQCNPAHQVCSGGRIYNERARQCVCPSSKPNWNGRQCVLYTTNPGLPPGGEIRPNCSGGRYYDQKSKSCRCPSNKPLFANGQCRGLPGGIKLPPGIKLPGVR